MIFLRQTLYLSQEINVMRKRFQEAPHKDRQGGGPGRPAEGNRGSFREARGAARGMWTQSWPGPWRESRPEEGSRKSQNGGERLGRRRQRRRPWRNAVGELLAGGLSTPGIPPGDNKSALGDRPEAIGPGRPTRERLISAQGPENGSHRGCTPRPWYRDRGWIPAPVRAGPC